MITIVNARDIDGALFSIGLNGSKVVSVQPQMSAHILSQPRAALSLASWDGSLAELVDAGGAVIVPAGIDMHVHSRDPGLTHKEDWATLAKGAWHGGVTAVCDMPNTIPTTTTRAAVVDKVGRAAKAGLEVRPMVGVTAANIGDLATFCRDPDLPIGGFKVFYGRSTGDLFFDDLDLLAKAIPESAPVPIVFHSEDQCSVDHNASTFASQLQGRSPADFSVHSQVRSSVAAHKSTAAILTWAAERYRGPVHIAHVSTPVEVELIAAAREKGARVTCEVAPHHLLLTTDDYALLGARAKMNPPLRSPAEVFELRRLVGQGYVDVFATDHAPHLLVEKATTVAAAPSGVPALEFFYQLLFACADLCGLPRRQAITMATATPATLCGFRHLGRLAPGLAADFAALAMEPMAVLGADIVSKCGWTPYEGRTLPCQVLGTWKDGRRRGYGPR